MYRFDDLFDNFTAYFNNLTLILLGMKIFIHFSILLFRFSRFQLQQTEDEAELAIFVPADTMAKKLFSKSSAPRRKPPCRTRLATSGGKLRISCAGWSTTHREDGITHKRLRPPWLIRRSASSFDTPSGSAALRPAIWTPAPAHAGAASLLPTMTGRLP